MSKATTGRLVIITGANSGIGKAAALKFAQEGWRVIMACRNLERGRRALQEISAATGSQTLYLRQLDISSFDSIQRFCEDFQREFTTLDALIHNAGYFEHGLKTYQFSADGLELTFATNVFGPLLMTELLRENLARAADPRVLHAASTNIKHFFDPKREIEFDNLRGEFAGKRPYTVYKMYGDSKMGLLLLTNRMAETYREQGIKVNAVMIPQVKIGSEALSRMTGLYRLIGPLIQNWNPNALEPAEMADRYYQICAAEEYRMVTGALIDAKGRILPPVAERQLNPFRLIGELISTRHTPAYANNPTKVEQMWNLGREVIAQALSR